MRWMAGTTFLIGCTLLAWLPAASASDAFALLPDDAETLVGVDLASVRNAPLYQRMGPGMRRALDGYLGGMGSPMGLDLERDVDRITVGYRGQASDRSHSLAVVEGDLSALKRTDRFESFFSVADQHGDHTLYETKNHTGPTPIVFTFLDETTALIGAREAVTEGLDRYDESLTARSARSLALQDAARGLADEGQTWMVTDAPSMGSAAAGMTGGLGALLRSLNRVTMAANILDGLDLAIRGRCETAEDAAAMVKGTQALLFVMRAGNTKAHPEVSQALQAVQLNSAADEFQLDVSLTEAEWIGLVDTFTKRSPGDALP